MTTHKIDTPNNLKHGRRLTKRQRQICRKEGLRAIDGNDFRSAGELAGLFDCHRDTTRYWMNKNAPELPGPKPGRRVKPMNEDVIEAAIWYRELGGSTPVITKALDEEFPREKVTAYQVARLKKEKQWPDLRPPRAKKSFQKFQRTEPGFIHFDTIVGPSPSDPVIFTARERSSRFAFVRVSQPRDSESAAMFLQEVVSGCPLKIHTILTDNGSEFAGDFATLAKTLHLEHRHTRPYRPQTNGLIERFNGQLKEAMGAHQGWWHYGPDRPSDHDLFQRERFKTPLPDKTVLRMQKDLDRWLTWINYVQPNRRIGWQTPLAWLQQLKKDRPARFKRSLDTIISTDRLQQISKGLRGLRYLPKPPDYWLPTAGLSIDL